MSAVFHYRPDEARQAETTEQESEMVEIAYRIPGDPRGFRRKTFKTEAQAEKFIAKLIEKEGEGVEIRWATN